jgi:hypothetical protein
MSEAPRPVLTEEDIRFVAHEYRLRGPIEHREFAKGSPAVAKARLRTPGGDWMLKRRATDDAGPLARVHAFQCHLEARCCPVAPLRTNRAGLTVTRGASGTFEIFGWVSGERPRLTLDEAAEVGATVGAMLRAAATFVPPPGARPAAAPRADPPAFDPLRLASAACRADPSQDGAAVREAAASVVARALEAHSRASRAGAFRSAVAFVHGDMHAGNVLFSEGRLAAVLDFDACRLDFRVREIASAMFHFANVGAPLDPPPDSGAELRVENALAVAMGAANGIGAPLEPYEAAALPWLMIGACTSEALSVIARTGRFGAVPALEMLRFVDRKASWIESNASRLLPP